MRNNVLGTRVPAQSSRKYSRVPGYYFPEIIGYPFKAGTRRVTPLLDVYLGLISGKYSHRDYARMFCTGAGVGHHCSYFCCYCCQDYCYTATTAAATITIAATTGTNNTTPTTITAPAPVNAATATVTDVTDKISLEDGAPARLPPPPPRPPQVATQLGAFI